MKRRLVLLGCIAFLSGCSSAAPPDGAKDAHDAQSQTPTLPPPKPVPVPQGTRREPTLREKRVIDELMGSAERVRGLAFKQPVPVLVEDRDRITSYVESQIEDEELDRARVVYAALGLLPPDLDVRALLLRLMGEQVVGYYDAEEKHLVVRDDVMRAFGRGDDMNAEEGSELSEARIVLVHELVHALQDQHLNLFANIHATRDTDADNAFHALVEGDATLAMIGYALERENIPLSRLTSNPAQIQSFSDVVRRSPLAGTELEQAPAIIRVPLLSAYVDGLAFCASLHGMGGGFAAVDRAHAAPPVSSEQVLHPLRFAEPVDVPQQVTLPDLPELKAAGYEVVREDTLGELEIGVYFGQGAREVDAKRAADGWDGDRLRVYKSATEPPAVVWLSVWDSERDAQEAEAAAAHVARQFQTPPPDRWEVVRKAKKLLIVRDLAPQLRARIPALALGP